MVAAGTVGLTVVVCPPGVAVTVYEVIADAPVLVGFAHVTVASVSPASAATELTGAGATQRFSMKD
jgi:hypothetical protein